MGASVRIEDEAFSDERYSDLAAAAGLADADHARGKMLRLWRQCTIEQTHFLSRDVVCRILGDGGVAALVLARLGEDTERGIRIRGTRGRIEWLKKLRDNGKFGARGGRPRNNPQGLPNSKPTRVSKNAKSETPPAPAPAPAPAPPDPESPSLGDPLPTQAERAAVRGRVRAELDAARARAGAARKARVTPLLAFDPGLDDHLNGKLMLAPTRQALRDLEQAALHAVAMAELRFSQGTESFEWFTGAIFKGGNFARFAGMTPDGAKRPRVASSVPAPQRPDRGPDPVVLSAAARAEAHALLRAEHLDDEDESEAS